MSARRTTFASLALFLLMALLAGCTETKEDLLTQGNLDLWRKQYDTAIKTFDRVLAMDPANADAHRGLANAYGMKEDTAKQESYLLKAYALPSLSAKEKAFFAEELEKLYLEKATKAEGEDAAYEAALKSALTYNEKSKAAMLLAKFYITAGEKAEQAGKMKEAAELFGRVRDLPVAGKLAAKAETKRDAALHAVLKERFTKAFPERQEALVKDGKFDAERKRWVASVSTSMPEDLDPKDPQLDEKGGAIGSQAAYESLLSLLAAQAELELPRPIPQIDFPSWSVDKATWVRKPKEFTVTVSIDFEEGIKAMYFLQKINESQKAARAVPPSSEPAAPEAPAAAPEAPAAAPEAPAAAPAATPEAPAAAPAAPAPAPAAPAPAPEAPAAAPAPQQ